ncbi:hypothetical protein WH95_08295 [Kiloniella litopenaei]|uniref:Uncharacterized protein n=1 Tax=Kiloniella litopenaei TaxID=1549748 RepID=A0A0M2R9D2_9PROT|nr:hypothetical protein [Kiloniella litopenaei]KKJ77074.1 hypothetical protein WH95_08295 [Kiloniella litopenaei]
MERILHILLILTFALSTPLVTAKAAGHWNDNTHHYPVISEQINTDVSGSDIFGVSQQDQSLPSEKQAMEECTKIMHCSSSSSYFLTTNTQQYVDFYQHSLWSLLQEQRLLDQSPAVDLPPPRFL